MAGEVVFVFGIRKAANFAFAAFLMRPSVPVFPPLFTCTRAIAAILASNIDLNAPKPPFSTALPLH
jgi:hypothetical protein